ncbi:MAG: uroporphyrinogen-III synthase [Hydrogenibacillus sp.]|nr:uroporphyrinogen-III synthase [Hydrogenibacillus sp.]
MGETRGPGGTGPTAEPGAPDERPLIGRRVVVTRARHQGRSLVDRFFALGAEVLHIPLIRLSPVPLKADLARALCAAREADWLIFSSQNGVEAFFALYDEAGCPPLLARGPKRVAVGPKTAEALMRHAHAADVVADEFTAEGIVEALTSRISPGERAVVVRGNLSRDVVAPALRALGLEATSIVVYDNTRDADGVRRLAQTFITGVVDAVTLTSPSVADAVADALASARLSASAADVRPPGVYLSIGRVTTARARALGLLPVVEAFPYTEEGLVSAFVAYVSGAYGSSGARGREG